MTRLALLACAVAAAACTASCTASYRPETPRGRAGAPINVLQPRWDRQLVRHGLLAYQPQEWATAAIDRQGTIYVGSSAGRFYAMRAADGAPLWSLRAGGAISSTPLLDERAGTVYFGGDDGQMYAVDMRTGKLKWAYRTQGKIRRPAVVREGFLLFTTSEERIYAVDATSGKWRWQYDREAPEGFTIQGHAGIAVQGTMVYTGFADGVLVALRIYSGDVVWTRSLAGGKTRFVDVDTTPVIVGDLLYTSSYSSGVYAITWENGSVRWQYPAEAVTGLIEHAGRVYFVAPRTGLVALDTAGRPLWQQAIAKGVPSYPVAAGPYLFLAGSESGLFAVSARDGELLEYFDPGRGMSAAPAVGAGYLAVLSDWGKLYTFSIVQQPLSQEG